MIIICSTDNSNTQEIKIKIINMENLPKEMLLKIIGDKKLEDLPNEVLVYIIADRERHMKLQEFQIDEKNKIIQKQKDCIDELEEKIKDLEKDIRKEASAYDNALPPYVVGDLPQSEMDFSNHTDAELHKIKKKNFYDFLKENCVSTSVLIDNRETLGYDCEQQACAACKTIYTAFRTWAIDNHIIPGPVKGCKNVFTTKEFTQRLVRESKKKFPDIEVKYGTHKSKFGTEQNPRVFIKLKN